MDFCMHCMAGYVDERGFCRRCHKPPNDFNRNPEAPPFIFPLRQGRYYLGDVLGQGGFGITYQAWDTVQRKRVAVKEFFPKGASVRDPVSYIQRLAPREDGGSLGDYYEHVKRNFFEEARLIYSLRDLPEIFTIYECFEELGTVFYSMEFLVGETLEQFSKRLGHVTWERIAPYIRDVAQSLQTLHERNLIHRDISPDNIMIDTNGKVWLLDLGAARVLNVNRELPNVSQVTHMVFKEGFSPPEQYTDAEKIGFGITYSKRH